MNPRANLKLLLAAVSVSLVASCNSPTLPLPPPSDSVQVTRDGEFALVSGPKDAVEPFALVTGYNDRTSTGVVVTANADGVFALRIPALPGDTIELWQRVGNSPPAIVITVPQPTTP
jgi:hypothetical protein